MESSLLKCALGTIYEQQTKGPTSVCSLNSDKGTQLLLAVVLRHAIGSMEVLEDILLRLNEDKHLQRILRGWQRALHLYYKDRTGSEYTKESIH